MTARNPRARIGFVAPSRVIDRRAADLYRLLPRDVLPVLTCLGVPRWSDDRCVRDALLDLEGRVRALRDHHADVILLGGHPVGAWDGARGEEELVAVVEDWTGLPTTTTPRAAIRALAYLGARRIALATPLEPFQADKVARFLEDGGYEVAGRHALGVPRERLGLLDDDAAYRAARAAVAETDGADTVYLASAAWPTLDTIARLQRELRIPVVSSVVASTWHALELAGVALHRPELGQLVATGCRPT